jgi:protein prenyltransferase alpha subunit repeat containing protein 1
MAALDDVDTSGLLMQIDRLFEKYTVDEIGLTTDINLPPIVFIENRIGISVVVLKPLYKHFTELFYRLVSLIASAHMSISSVAPELNSFTRGILLVKGDFPMAYNYRKKLIELELIQVEDEIALTKVIFSRTPKSPSGWQHRRWCLQFRQRRSGRRRLLLAEIETEKELCRVMGEMHAKNYYSWTHRLWLLQLMNEEQVSDGNFNHFFLFPL